MSSEPGLPKVSRRVLEWASTRLGLPELADDAAELFAQRVSRSGERAARRWYRRQAIAVLRPALFRMHMPAAGGTSTGGFSTGGSSARGGWWSNVSMLDFRLGVRMLLRYPGLTVVAGVAMAFAIAVGAATFEFARDALYPRLPIEDGDRIVRMHQLDARTASRTGIPASDFQVWKGALRSVEAVGAFHEVSRNIWLNETDAVPVDGIAVSAAAFRIAAVPPLFGRHLLESDERAGAAPVVVLGHALWRSRFGSDANVVGRAIRLGDTRSTVVGVMPEGHAFPAPADIYVPLRTDELAAQSLSGAVAPAMTGFGRLVPGTTLKEARTELAALGARGGTADPADSEHLTAALEPYAYPLLTASGILNNVVFALTAFFLIMLMIVVCANVALLLFARAATRESEITVRTALGASRGRIVVQLFAEALVLATVAAVVGLTAAAAGLRWAMSLANADPKGAMPFWISDTLSPATIVWVVLLALVGAAVAGVIPALQVTGRDLHAQLQRGAGRGSGIRMGRLWTGIVVAQVALTVIVMPIVVAMGAVYWKVRSAEAGVATEEFLVARLEPGIETAQFDEIRRELHSRLAAEPWIRGIAVADMAWPGWMRSRPLEVDGVPAPEGHGAERTSQHISVDAAFFDVMGARFVAGQSLSAGDVEVGRRAVVVNESFVHHVLGGRNAIGQRIRIGGMGDENAPWFEIIGVVADLGLNPYTDLPHRGVIFHPLAADGVTRLAFMLRVAGDPAVYANRVRALALQIEPTLRMQPPHALDQLMARPVIEYGAWFRIVLAGAAIALLLTLAGIYAVMAFTVARRTREIGVRVALGARPRQVVVSIFRRAAAQVGFGVITGGAVIPLIMLFVSRMVQPGPDWPPLVHVGLILGGYLATMMGACLLACVVPLRRALSVQPTEALAGDA